MEQDSIFTLVDADFYESLSQYAANAEYLTLLESYLPDYWTIYRSDIWIHCHVSPIKVAQGFKIHISSDQSYAHATLATVVPICVDMSINFKVVADPFLLNLINSKGYPRGYSGKFLTLYPESLDCFQNALELLYQCTSQQNLMGPYILSDKRYKDSNVVFYRYGGFRLQHRLNPDGTKTPILEAPAGTKIPDKREPFFDLPDWVVDPFATNQLNIGETSYNLKGRYSIESVFAFSNAGGVYLAEDTHSGEHVVIKEARPRTNSWTVGDRSWDAVHLLEREHMILGTLAELECIPTPLDFFQEWEHSFLVEEKVDGVTLNTFWAMQELVLAPHIRRDTAIDKFVSTFIWIAQNLIAMTEAVHERGVIIGDISPRNILVNSTTKRLWFIDFESAVQMHDAYEVQRYAVQWGTPGFKSPSRGSRDHLLPEDDYYGLAMTFFSSIVPATNLVHLCPEARRRFMLKFVDLGIPVELESLIHSLETGAIEPAKALLGQLREKWSPACPSNEASLRRIRTPEVSTSLVSHGELRETIDKMVDYILANSSPKRADRLWPAHFKVFSTNPLSVAYGACGVLLFLTHALGECPKEAEEWLLSHRIDVGDYPPSFYIGLAGIACCLHQFGFEDRAADVMRSTYSSPMLYSEPGVFLGIAGWGIASLYFFGQTGRQEFLDQAIEAGNYLVESAEHDGDHVFWRCQSDGRVHYGYGYGSSGIALFLVNLFAVTGLDRYRTFALKGLEHDLSKKVATKAGVQWRRFEGDALLYPYWIQGSSGIGSVVVRFARLLGDEHYMSVARQIADDAFIKYSFSPGLFEGLTGIGEFMFDVYQTTGQQEYLSKTLDITDTLQWYRIDRPEGIAYPGRWLMRISTDYGTGAAGIGLFFLRILDSGPRVLVDIESKVADN